MIMTATALNNPARRRLKQSPESKKENGKGNQVLFNSKEPAALEINPGKEYHTP